MPAHDPRIFPQAPGSMDVWIAKDGNAVWEIGVLRMRPDGVVYAEKKFPNVGLTKGGEQMSEERMETQEGGQGGSGGGEESGGQGGSGGQEGGGEEQSS